VLALTGDPGAAARAINAVMPGASVGVAPFLQRLPSLNAAQRAAAVNLGIIPDSGSYAVASTSADRLAGIDALLTISPAAPARASVQSPRPVQASYARQPARAAVQPVAAKPKVWLQLASGQNVDDFAGRFSRLKSKSPELFYGIKPYVSRSADRARLLVGPFRGTSDADIFAEDLKTIGVDAFRFTNSQTDRIAPLAM
jgi:hypothetical protein